MQLFDNDTPSDLRAQILTYRLSELMTDRERARLLGLPEGCRIRENAKVLAPEKLQCGHHVWIGEGAILDAQGGLSIGDYTQVGLSVMIWTHSSHKQALRSQTCGSKENIVYKPTKIGSNCFIAGPSVISAGVTIGDRVIITPLSFVEHDLPDGAVYSNNRFRRDLETTIGKLKAFTGELLQVIQESKLAPPERMEALLSQYKQL
jgi:acetyltransferase-like isoleucine patch superfamily enzyme